MNDRTAKTVDLLLRIAALCIVFGVICIFYKVTEPEAIPEPKAIPQATPTPTNEPLKPSIYKSGNYPLTENEDITEHTESVKTALFYATEPIGRYYITAYSHIETGSRITASGSKVHKGTITTAAADVPKYFKFGDYVLVNDRIYRIEDTGSAVKKRHLDLYEPDMKKLDGYTGYAQVYRVTFPFGTPKDN